AICDPVTSPLAAVVMAGGLGTRMHSATPKHLHPLLGRRMVDWVILAARDAGAEPVVVTASPDTRDLYPGLTVAIQEQPLGAGDATPEELALGEVNSGIYVFSADRLWSAIDRLKPHNVQGELYVTDTLGFLVGDGDRVAVHVAPDPVDAEGINTRAELAAAAAHLRKRINAGHMAAGVTIVDPATTWIEPTVELAADTTILPFTILRGSTRIETGAEIGPHSVAVDARVGPSVTVGPFCYLRPGTELAAGSK